MNKAFDDFTWKNGSSGGTPLNATNLNKINSAVDTIDDRVITLDGRWIASTVDLQEGSPLAAGTFYAVYEEPSV